MKKYKVKSSKNPNTLKRKGLINQIIERENHKRKERETTEKRFRESNKTKKKT